ncbi:protein of unknown function [Nitrospira japonica]|uniref:Uncharacterized protein n=1 Tax=Nitrospira japonica TaxID=1325564 RepID=A0A1W1IAJ8_9BACT|nr:hypothetical protein [Nitrospira japonica]SLM49793.1 protein of unknown function [Nitrospira japonica]
MNQVPLMTTDEHAQMSRRTFFRKAGLIGIGVSLMDLAPKVLLPSARAERTLASSSQSDPQTTQSRLRTRTELLTILQGHPGGAQAIETARRRGANFSLGTNPTQPPQVQGTPPVTLFSFSLLLVPGQLQVGQSWVMFHVVDILKNSAINLRVSSTKSWASFQIDFPKNGWYLLNIEGLQTSGGAISARLVKNEQGGPIVQTWSYPSVPGTSEQKPIHRSFPAMFEYTGGTKGAILYLDNGSFSFVQFSAESL